jgi:hypothetical protein
VNYMGIGGMQWLCKASGKVERVGHYGSLGGLIPVMRIKCLKFKMSGNVCNFTVMEARTK